jgi:hypothetical protein
MPFGLKFIILLVPVFGFLFFFHQRRKPLWSFVAIIYLLSVVAFSLLNLVKYVYANYHHPPEWDFLCFWTSGQVAIRGENFYDPESFYELSLPYSPSDGFREEWMDVGFWYPPMTMFLFLPLGLFDISKAYLMWQMLNLVLCFGCMYGLWRSFLEEQGISGFLLIAELLLLLTPAHTTFRFGQTNFLILFLFLLFWHNRSEAWSGAFLAFCAVAKPYMALLYLYLLITRKWRLLAVAILTMLILVFLSSVIFGPDVFAVFLNNPAPNVPDYYYTEGVNQSLLATILRTTGYQEGDGSPLSNPFFWGISFLLMLITVLSIVRNQDGKAEWPILSSLFLALIIYPGTLTHYGVFLIVPVISLLHQSNRSVKERIGIFCVILITYLLAGYNNSGNYVFFAHLFMWLVCISLGMSVWNKTSEHGPELSFSH